jgi:predicted small metal-binding protein
MKMLHCGDVMPGCDAVITGKDSDEVLEKAEAHARKEHNATFFPPHLLDEIERAIKDGDDRAHAR